MSRQDANAAFARSSFLYGGNAAYVEQLQSRYEANPASVDAEWRAFFARRGRASSSCTVPSMRTRVKPCARNSLNFRSFAQRIW